MSTARIKGESNVTWTDCFRRRCESNNDSFEKDICKELCKRDAAQEALGNVRGLIGDCDKAKNPRSCVRSVNDTATAWNNRITRIDAKVNNLKLKRDKYRAKTGRK